MKTQKINAVTISFAAMMIGAFLICVLLRLLCRL